MQETKTMMTSRDGKRNPSWTREELILALDYYLDHRNEDPRPNSEGISYLVAQIAKVSQTLGLTSTVVPLRSASAVEMKLRNFAAHDPLYTESGRTSLKRGNQLEAILWNEFSERPGELKRIASSIIALANTADVTSIDAGEDEFNILNGATGSFSPVYGLLPDPAEADWVPPSDLPSEHEVRLVQSGDTIRRLTHKGASSAARVTPASKLNRRTRKIKMDERGMHNDQITSTLEKLIDDLEHEIAHLNTEGAHLFGLSQYEEAMKRAELGRRLQTFRQKVVEIRSDWSGISEMVPILSEAEELDSNEVSSDTPRKSPRKSLIVIMDDGRVISSKTAAETFAKAIIEMGVEQVKSLGLEVNREPLISDTPSERYNTANIDGYYVMTHSSTSHKKDLLTRIDDELGVKLSVKVSD